MNSTAIELRGQRHAHQLLCLVLQSFMYQLLKGVAHMHKHGVMHRDLKPQNLLVDDSTAHPLLKVADLGLGRHFTIPIKAYTHEVGGMERGAGGCHCSSFWSGIFGWLVAQTHSQGHTLVPRPNAPQIVTLWYRAPEVLLGATHYAPAVDIWSIACIFAELARKVRTVSESRWTACKSQPAAVHAAEWLVRHCWCAGDGRLPAPFHDTAMAAPAWRTLPALQQAIFPGDSELQQLLHIFKLLGTPSEEVWPGVTKLRDWHEFPQWHGQDLHQVGNVSKRHAKWFSNIAGISDQMYRYWHGQSSCRWILDAQATHGCTPPHSCAGVPAAVP